MKGTKHYVIKFKFLLVRIIAPWLLKCLFHFVPRNSKSVLIIKNDGIGDYILFRNHLECISQSNKYKDQKIHVVINEGSIDLARHLDVGIVESISVYNDSYFLQWKLVHLMISLQLLRPHTIIYTNLSRSFTTDWLVGALVAKNKIGFHSDTVNQPANLLAQTDLFYTQLIDVKDKRLHEFDNNRQICTAIAGQPCVCEKPVISKQKLNILKHNSIVFFIGGSTIAKRWPAELIAGLCKSLIADLATSIIVSGSANEHPAAKQIEADVANTYLKNLVGELSTLELCNLIGGTRLLISNDTVAIHIAAALNTPFVCIAKGDMYGRFIPYPAHIYKFGHTVLPHNFKPADNSYQLWSNSNIADVLVNDVYNTVDQALENTQLSNGSTGT